MLSAMSSKCLRVIGASLVCVFASVPGRVASSCQLAPGRVLCGGVCPYLLGQHVPAC